MLLPAVAFTLLFYCNTIAHVVLALPALVLPGRRGLWCAVHSWIAVNQWLLRVCCGISHEIRFVDRIPSGPLIVAAKHQSTWEIFSLLSLFADPVFILKREVMWLPFFNLYCLKGGMIPVERGARSLAPIKMMKQAQKRIAAGRQILIFPEGTRRPAGATPNYKYGVVELYAKLGVPCLPIALNAGLYWPRRTLRFRPGTIRAEVLPPIPPGLSEEAFFARLQGSIETATNRLLAEGERELAGLGRVLGRHG
jgi:1-acyl-sn-glycerol-3-phosphate acyltransferase